MVRAIGTSGDFEQDMEIYSDSVQYILYPGTEEAYGAACFFMPTTDPVEQQLSFFNKFSRMICVIN